MSPSNYLSPLLCSLPSTLHDGRRFIIASEVNEGMSWDEAGIKKLTGSDTIVARYLHKNPVTFRPTHKLWFGTNYKPKTRDNNFSFWRRVRVVACRATFKGEKDDKSLSDTLLGQLKGILAWAVRGTMKWYETGLPVSKAIDEATQQYEAENDVWGTLPCGLLLIR